MTDSTCTGDANKCCGNCGDDGVGRIYSPDDKIECRICGHRTSTKREMINHLTEYHPSDIPIKAIKSLRQLDLLDDCMGIYNREGVFLPATSEPTTDPGLFSTYEDVNYFIDKAFKTLKEIVHVREEENEMQVL